MAKTTEKKRPSNNPAGRPPTGDTKVMIGIYVPESLIKKFGGGKVGKEHIRIKVKHYLGIK